MDCKMDKKYWTNFDLLDAVKAISAQKGLVYTKAHFSVAEELLFQIGDLSIHSSQSEEDKKLIKNFRSKYIRVINQFKQWRNNYSGPAAQQQMGIFKQIQPRRSRQTIPPHVGN